MLRVYVYLLRTVSAARVGEWVWLQAVAAGRQRTQLRAQQLPAAAAAKRGICALVVAGGGWCWLPVRPSAPQETEGCCRKLARRASASVGEREHGEHGPRNPVAVTVSSSPYVNPLNF